MHDGGLGGSVVLVTGAAGYLGRAIVEGLCRDGAIPALNGRSLVALQDVAASLSSSGYDSILAPGDVGDTALMARVLTDVAAAAQARGRRFDGLVNNAFAGTSADKAANFADLFAAAARVNLGATAQLTLDFCDLPCDGPRSVVNVASIYGVVSPDPALYPEGVPINPLHYGATKAGVLQLTRTLAVHLAPRSVRVNAVIPGPFPKPEVQRSEPEFARNLAQRLPMKRLGEPHEVYPPIRFLLRRDASFVTGASITVDGGWTAI